MSVQLSLSLSFSLSLSLSLISIRLLGEDEDVYHCHGTRRELLLEDGLNVLRTHGGRHGLAWVPHRTHCRRNRLAGVHDWCFRRRVFAQRRVQHTAELEVPDAGKLRCIEFGLVYRV